MELEAIWLAFKHQKYQQCFTKAQLLALCHHIQLFVNHRGEHWSKEVCYILFSNFKQTSQTGWNEFSINAILFHFISAVPYARTAKILILMSIPGQILFIYIADYIHMSKSTIGPAFVLSYLLVSSLQVSILIYRFSMTKRDFFTGKRLFFCSWVEKIVRINLA